MWYLEAFDNDTELLAGEYLLNEMSVEIVKEILEIDDHDFEVPVAVRQNDVPLQKVSEFAKYTNEPFKLDQNCTYEVAFLTE